MMGKLWRRIHFLLNRRSMERELAEEMEAHRDMMPADQRAAFGNLLRLREDSREIWTWTWIEQFWQDLTYGARVLMRAPAFTAGAVAVLALGVGVNLGELQVFDAVLFHRVGVPDASSVFQFIRTSSQGMRLSFPSAFVDLYRPENHSFDWLVSEDWRFNVMLDADSDIRANFVSPDYFSRLAVVPTCGRLPDMRDSQAGAPAVAALGYEYWQKHFAADPHVVGRLVHINNKPVRIVGVLPYSFDGLSPRRTGVWLPVTLRPTLTEASRAEDALFGKLKSGVSLAAAEAELSAGLTAELIRTEPRIFLSTEQVQGQSLGWILKHRTRENPAVAIFIMMVMLILLSACANLGNMILARGLARQREIGIRLAVGASPTRVVRQLMTENLILAVLGATAGLVFGMSASRMLLDAIDAPPDIHLRLGFPIFLAAFGLTLLSAIVFGLPSAFKIVQQSPRNSRYRQILVGVQVAVSSLLLIASGVLARNGIRAASIDLAFDYRNMVLIDPQLYRPKQPPAAVHRRLEELTSRVSALPGVDGVTSADVAPLSGRFSPISVSGLPDIYQNMVAPTYFSVMNLPVVRGRVFREGEPDLIVVSESAARARWPNQDPVGKIWNLQGADRTVAGVVRDSGGNLFTDRDSVEAYIPVQDGAEERTVLIVHTRGDPALLARGISQAAAAMNQHVSVSLMSASRDAFLEIERKLITMIGSLAVVATSLAAAGMFALVAFVVAQRKRELGIRIAIGARPRHILWTLLKENLKPTAAGLVAGILMAAALFSLMQGTVILGSNEPADVAGFTAGVACFVLIAALATLSPALRALRIDPSETLREE